MCCHLITAVTFIVGPRGCQKEREVDEEMRRHNGRFIVMRINS